MHLPKSEIPELEAQGGSHAGIGYLFLRQRDVGADRLSPNVRRSSIRRLHDAGPAARDHHIVGTTLSLAGRRRQPPELTSLVVIGRQSHTPPRDGNGPLPVRVLRPPCQVHFGPRQPLTSGVRVHEPRATQPHNGGTNPTFALEQ